MDELYDTFLKAVSSDTDLLDAMKAVQDMSPPPINTMFKKQSKADAIKKMEARKAMNAVYVPPTTPGKLTRYLMGRYFWKKEKLSHCKLFACSFISNYLFSTKFLSFSTILLEEDMMLEFQ